MQRAEGRNYPEKISLRALLAVLLFIFLGLSADASGQKASESLQVFRDNSDWWSIIGGTEDDGGLQPQEKDTPDRTFKILGVTVGTDEFAAVESKLGKAVVVVRGDASTAREQLCYQSADRRMHLIFESGEVQYAFYLFVGGADWTGSNLCAESQLVTGETGTVSGLRLGQSPDKVEAILGKPTKTLPSGDLIYFRQIMKRNSADNLRKAREAEPTLSDKEFHEDFDFYYLSVYIVAKFSDSKLTYLGVSKSETT